MARVLIEEEKTLAQEMLVRAKAAMKAIENYDQAQVDRLCQAVGWRRS
jgi:sulfoacetaldehyde dehydrogenase